MVATGGIGRDMMRHTEDILAAELVEVVVGVVATALVVVEDRAEPSY